MKSTLKAVEKLLVEIDQLRDELLNTKNLGDDYWKKCDVVEEKFWTYAQSLEPGLYPGRVVTWGQGDGHAIYVVKSIGKDIVTLLHVPLGDAWRSPVVQNGKAMRSAVEQALRFSDGMKEIFAKEREKQKQPATN